MNTVYLYALSANFCFATASQVFTHYSRTTSSVWMNTIKTLVALFAFTAVVLASGGFTALGGVYILLLFLSGALGLGLGDWFLLTSFREMGPGRTMILFGFQPIIFGLFGFFIFQQVLNIEKFWGILFFVLCLITISSESFRVDRHFHLKGISMAFAGMCLDAVGAMLSRYVFDHNPSLSVFEGNFYRCLGALAFFFIFTRFKPMNFRTTWQNQSRRGQIVLIIGSILGTFVSLSLYMKALQSAHLASLAGIAITGTVFSSIFECLVQRKWPSGYLIVAFVFFLCGMRLILF